MTATHEAIVQDFPGVGVLFPRFFDDGRDYYAEFMAAHAPQALTESNKAGVALRKGLYMSRVEPVGPGDGLAFHMLRCSTNFHGPTDNFRAVDHDILARTNAAVRRHFPGAAPVNHVLAQVYHNRRAGRGVREAKAVIKRHADKTKDMPRNGVLAFATFYNFDGCAAGPCPLDPLDVAYKRKSSMLTDMLFVLKQPEHHPDLPARVRIKLYPNSLLVVPLETNRIYTHEIKAPVLPAHVLPTRLGYVMRCSNQRAVHRDGRTYLLGADGEEPLQAMTPDVAAAVRAAYLQENQSDAVVEYPVFPASFNEGDYQAPALAPLQ